MKKYRVATDFSFFTELAESRQDLKEILARKYGITKYTAYWAIEEGA